jgi:hypothetical protein
MAQEIGLQHYPGAAGLLLWANAVLDAHHPVALLGMAGLDPATLEARVLPRLTTMEVAWLVIGLLHTDHPAFARLADAAIRELIGRRQPATGVFLHASPQAPLRHRMRRRVANFADQVYPLQALAMAAVARGDAGLRELATECAARMVAGQGPLGQWWWHHDAFSGKVAEGYPVYSIHQHSMAPMALHALAAAGGPAHTRAIARSRAWLWENETSAEMVDPVAGAIWRGLDREETSRTALLRKARLVAGWSAAELGPPPLRLNPEMRPYEWGWLFYVSGIEAGAPTGRHII